MSEKTTTMKQEFLAKLTAIDNMVDLDALRVEYLAKNGLITAAKVYSDSMDWALPAAIEAALTGCRFELAAMQDALRAGIDDTEVANDLCVLLSQQQI